MKNKKYYCDFCHKELHKDDPVFVTEDYAYFFCSVTCFICSEGYVYDTLEEAIEGALEND